MIETSDFLNSIKYGSIVFPEVKESPITFLGIAKQPHYEDVWSNIYAFYFDVNAEHGMRNLFIDALLSNIAKHDSQFEFDFNFNIIREYSTENKGRIDLLLKSHKEAIIIENKVNHILNNDLNDYWQSVESPSKIGIVLTLNRVLNVPHPQFINITHLELMQSVMQQLGGYIIGSNPKFITFLTDFYQNIINLSTTMDTQNIKLFYNYNSEIVKVVELQQNVKQHIKSEVKKAAELIGLKNYTLGGANEDRFSYYVSSRNNNLLYTILFEKLLSPERELMIIVELQNDLLKDREQYKSIDFDNSERALMKEEAFYGGKERYAHFALQIFHLENADIENLSGYIARKINESKLKCIFEKIEAIVPVRQ
ncbi:PD-(D/E)XK nuclease superfamily protein [Breznakibacter xylanolyticus]|uniref:PD-(D/E)XK nuclease superfamily protein n=1 Tax=Breznakibacter xylanolyticus TaxID=990 RepID=A0A2W7NBW8_9BACT|nr:PD-(D/E)XK nuclease family protein [Breznakibacter xylanolyticus]PZX10546.1 PD-(D/E)XK nuclease superfamily protein [Breznakibacter xylanolyticus]